MAHLPSVAAEVWGGGGGGGGGSGGQRGQRRAAGVAACSGGGGVWQWRWHVALLPIEELYWR
jgi:hypothetical protein